MKNRSYIWLVLNICLLFSLSSCENFLDKTPQDSPTRETFWKTASDASAGTVGAYWYFRNTLMGTGDFANDLMMYHGDHPTGLFNNLSTSGQNQFQGSYRSFSNSHITDWSKFYKLINTANMVVNMTENIPLIEFDSNESEAVKKKNVYIGEGLFIRAYTYFFMVRLWGEIPYVTEAISDASESIKDVPMDTEEDILDACLNDLSKAYNFLSWDDTHGIKASRANKGAVLALRAHILMWRNRQNKTTIDPQNYKDAIDAIEEIEKSGKYDLVRMDDYLKIWNGEGKTVETIFEFPYNRAAGEKLDKNSCFSKLIGYPLNTDRETSSVYKYSSTFLTIIDKYTNQGDRRRTDLWSRWGESTFQYTTKYSSVTYLNDDKTNWETDNNFVLFRLADLYLLKAEAYERLGDYNKARTYLKKIQIRAGINESVTDEIPDVKLAEEICDERIRELYLEGHNLYDWVRNGFYDKRNGYTTERYMKEGYLLPVNSEIIINNKYARQTPYWSDKMTN